ncbi:hypothetical protein DFQ26_001739 [Actinomortierella ambigua]|nr:hypothetical protein DFQ26_001739 [Actinomortierella ambigua]
MNNGNAAESAPSFYAKSSAASYPLPQDRSILHHQYHHIYHHHPLQQRTDGSTMHRSRVIDHSVHRPCEEGINIAVRISEVQRSPQGVELVSSSSYPGHWPWSITVKATSFANTLVIQIGRARRGVDGDHHSSGGDGEFVPRTGWRNALLFPTTAAIQQQQQQQQGHGHGLHAGHHHHHQHHQHPHHHPHHHHHHHQAQADGNQSDDSDEGDDDPPVENMNMPALMGAIRRGDLRLPFDPNRYRYISIYSPLRQAEVVSREYLSIQASDVKEHSFYHFQVWFSSALRIPRLVSSSLSRLQQSMLRLRKDSASANVCIRLVDPEDEDQDQGEPGTGGTSGGQSTDGSGEASNTSYDGRKDSKNQKKSPQFPDRCFSESSAARNEVTPEHDAVASQGTRKRSNVQKSDGVEGSAPAEDEQGGDSMGKKKARYEKDTSASLESLHHPTSPSTSTTLCDDQSKPLIPDKQETRADNHDIDPEDSDEEEVVVFAHKSILEGDAFFNRLLSGGFHEAVPDNNGMHIITLSREFFPTRQVIDTILDFVYAEVIIVDLLQPLYDHGLVSSTKDWHQYQHQRLRRDDGAPDPVARPHLPNLSAFSSDRIKANVFQCSHGLNALEIAKVARCPTRVLREVRQAPDAEKVEESKKGISRTDGRSSSATPSSSTSCPGTSTVKPESTTFSTTAETSSDNVPLLGGDDGSSIKQDSDQPSLTPCQEQLASLTQLWDDLYGAAHFMQNGHLQQIAFSQLQLDQRTTLARAMGRGCLFQEVEQAMHDYLIREQRPIFGNPSTNQLRPYFLVENPFQMAFLLSLTSTMAYGDRESMS